MDLSYQRAVDILTSTRVRDAFDMTRGIYAAVVLAGFGLPVAPFDLARTRILGKLSNDIDTVLSSSPPTRPHSLATARAMRRFTCF